MRRVTSPTLTHSRQLVSIALMKAPYPGSTTVVCTMGEHERCKGNFSCDCHLQGHAIPAAMRLTTPQEIRFPNGPSNGPKQF